MKNTLNKLSRKIAIVVLCFGLFIGSFLQVNAYDFRWTDFETSNFSGSYTSVVKNNLYWEERLNGVLAGGVTIGSPFYIQPFRPLFLSPWHVTYDVITNSGCALRPVYSGTNGLPGSTSFVITSTGATTTAFTFTTPVTQAGMLGISLFRNLGIGDCVVRFYQITDSTGALIWSPTLNQYNSGTTSVAVSVLQSTSSSMSTTTVIGKNDQLINFMLLFLLLVGVTGSIVIALKPLYVRK